MPDFRDRYKRNSSFLAGMDKILHIFCGKPHFGGLGRKILPRSNLPIAIFLIEIQLRNSAVLLL
jgi:hypothetical protein